MSLSKLQTTLKEHPNVGDIRGRGLFWGIELVQNRQTKEPFPSELNIAWKIWERCFDRGLIVYYSQGCADGINGDLIMVGPPFIVDESQLDEIVTRLTESIWEQFTN